MTCSFPAPGSRSSSGARPRLLSELCYHTPPHPGTTAEALCTFSEGTERPLLLSSPSFSHIFSQTHHFSLPPPRPCKLCSAEAVLLSPGRAAQSHSAPRHPAPSRSAELTEAPPGWPPFSEAFLYRVLGWPGSSLKIQMCHVSSRLSAAHQKIILDHKVIDTSLIICSQNSQCFLNRGATCPNVHSSYNAQWIFALSSRKCSCIITKNVILFKKYYLRLNI